MAKQKKRADGRYCKNVTIGRNEDGSLKRKMVYANTQRELDLKVADLTLQADKGIIIDDKNKTVDIWADEWLKTYTTHLKKNTVHNHRVIVNKHIKPNFKGIRLKDLKQYQVQSVLNSLEGKTVPFRFLITFNKILDAAVENDYIVKNIAATLQAPEYDTEEVQPITNEQIKITEDTDFLLHDICVSLIYSGMRISELINLVWPDVHLKRNEIKIHGDVKTPHSNRVIPIFEPFKKILDELSKTRIKNIDPKKDYVFLKDGEKCKLNDLSNMRYKCFDDVGFEFTFHQLRHTFITICYNAGVDVKQTQEWAGHANFNTTMDIYTHLSEQNKKDNTNKINEYLKSI